MKIIITEKTIYDGKNSQENKAKVENIRANLNMIFNNEHLDVVICEETHVDKEKIKVKKNSK